MDMYDGYIVHGTGHHNKPTQFRPRIFFDKVEAQMYCFATNRQAQKLAETNYRVPILDRGQFIACCEPVVDYLLVRLDGAHGTLALQLVSILIRNARKEAVTNAQGA